MSESPYAPPRAVVDDIESPAPFLERPPQVTRAVKCLWATLGVYFLMWVVYFQHPAPPNVPIAAVVVWNVAGCLLSIWVFRAIAKGRNWARILYLIYTVLSILWALILLEDVWDGLQSPRDVTTNLVNCGIALYACYLLFTKPAGLWFRSLQART